MQTNIYENKTYLSIYSMLPIGWDIARNDVVKRLGIDYFNKINFDLQCDNRKKG